MQISSLVWTVLVLLAAHALTLWKWRRDVRSSATRLGEMGGRLSEETRRREELERALETYYIPNWQDATERLGVSSICTCPPYPYRSSCLKHSPEMLRRQLSLLKQIEGSSFQQASFATLSDAAATG